MAGSSRRGSLLLQDPDFGAERALRRWHDVAGSPPPSGWRKQMEPTVARMLGVPGAAGAVVPIRLIGTTRPQPSNRSRPGPQAVFVCGGPPGRSSLYLSRIRSWDRRGVLLRREADEHTATAGGWFDEWATEHAQGGLVLLAAGVPVLRLRWTGERRAQLVDVFCAALAA